MQLTLTRCRWRWTASLQCTSISALRTRSISIASVRSCSICATPRTPISSSRCSWARGTSTTWRRWTSRRWPAARSRSSAASGSSSTRWLGWTRSRGSRTRESNRRRVSSSAPSASRRRPSTWRCRREAPTSPPQKSASATIAITAGSFANRRTFWIHLEGRSGYVASSPAFASPEAGWAQIGPSVDPRRRSSLSVVKHWPRLARSLFTDRGPRHVAPRAGIAVEIKTRDAKMVAPMLLSQVIIRSGKLIFLAGAFSPRCGSKGSCRSEHRAVRAGAQSSCVASPRQRNPGIWRNSSDRLR
mmetsp:Transcript_20092/g.46374  ORF Transcript_20092/g.46374 Transcript_20092/m.46374 type:complete len:301 (+) Transcript_20092:479-1381(+)